MVLQGLARPRDGEAVLQFGKLALIREIEK